MGRQRALAGPLPPYLPLTGRGGANVGEATSGSEGEGRQVWAEGGKEQDPAAIRATDC